VCAPMSEPESASVCETPATLDQCDIDRLLVLHGYKRDNVPQDVLKHCRKRYVSVIHANESQLGQAFIVKEYRYAFSTILSHLIVPHRAARACSGAAEYRELSLLTPHIHALVEVKCFGLVHQAFLIFSKIEGLRVNDFFREAISGQCLTNAEKRALIAQVARALREQHTSGIYNRDWKSENIIVSDDASKKKLHYVDLDGVSRTSNLKRRHWIKNLAQLNCSVTEPIRKADRLYFLDKYLDYRRKPRGERRALVAEIMKRTRCFRYLWPSYLAVLSECQPWYLPF